MYKKMAEIYDELMKDAPYDQWDRFTEQLIENKTVTDILEIGCGTGENALRLAQKGYNVTAFDLSEQMVQRAMQKCEKQQLNCRFLVDDAETFDFKQTFDLIISYCDVMNYIQSQDALKQTFKNAYNHLNQDGLFIFDVHSMSYIHWLIKQEIFTEISDDLCYVWLCEAGLYDGEIKHDLTFFINDQENKYQRHDELHIQRTYPVNEYQELLIEAGFNEIKVYFDFKIGVNQPEECNAQRVFFVCKK